jgi:hypothetical protein
MTTFFLSRRHEPSDYVEIEVKNDSGEAPLLDFILNPTALRSSDSTTETHSGVGGLTGNFLATYICFSAVLHKAFSHLN